MPLHAGAIPEYTKQILSHDAIGTSEGVIATSTTTSGTYGSFATIISGASVTKDVYGIELWFSNGSTSGASRPGIVTIGLDPAGGTTYTTETMVADLLIGSPSQWGQTSGWGVGFYFPYFIKSGTSIGVKLATLGTTARNVTCKAILLCAPRYPEITPVGRKIVTYGQGVLGLCQGTAITPGDAAEGAWTEIGTVAAGAYPWWWQVGVAIDDSIMTFMAGQLDLAIGDVTNKHIVYENQLVRMTASESIGIMPMYTGCARQAAPGDKIYVRMRMSTTPDTGYSVAVYGLY